MRLAFYAPMKPPDDPVPSGDRAVARALLAALGPKAQLASRFRSRDGAGDGALQHRLLGDAQQEVSRLLATGPRWDAWITYHNYYKAPDLIGPQVSARLGIPYLLIEATRARKRLGGPWDAFARLAEAACDQAQAILYLTQRDRQALERDRPPHQRLAYLPPFLPVEDLPPPARYATPPLLLAIGMMRRGDKLASYGRIALALARLRLKDWHLRILGDGPARAEVEALFAQFGARVTLAGAVPPGAVAAECAAAQALIWPGVNEAFGMAYLEAQAAGLPVLAEDRPGVREVLAPLPGLTRPAPDAAPQALADLASAILGDAGLWSRASHLARDRIASRHLLGPARATIRQVVTDIAGGSA